jgi:hypothetical protein
MNEEVHGENEVSLLILTEPAVMKEELNKQVYIEGTKAALLYGGIATALSAGLHYKALPGHRVYARITPVYRIFIVACSAMGSFFTRTDIALMNTDQAFSEKYSISRMRTPSVPDGFKHGVSWLEQNKTKVIVGVWGGVLAASLLYNFRRFVLFKLSFLF